MSPATVASSVALVAVAAGAAYVFTQSPQPPAATPATVSTKDAQAPKIAAPAATPPSTVAQANTTPAPTPTATGPAVTGKPADANKSPAEAALPSAWIGLPVIAADGSTVGQLTETRPHADGRSVVLIVKGSDQKTYEVSSAIASMQGRAIQVAASATEIGKMIR